MPLKDIQFYTPINVSIGAGESFRDTALSFTIDATKAFVFNVTGLSNATNAQNGISAIANCDGYSFEVSILDDSTLRVSTPRAGGAQFSTSFSVGIMEYTGAPGGGNEFIVHPEVSQLITSGDVIQIMGFTPTDVTRVVPFRRGLTWTGSLAGAAHVPHMGHITIEPVTLIGFNVFRHFSLHTVADHDPIIHYTPVEFIGSQWDVVVFASRGLTILPGVTRTTSVVTGVGPNGSLGSLGSWSQAFPIATKSAPFSTTASLGMAVWPHPTDPTTLRFRVSPNHSTAAGRAYFQAIGNPNLQVDHYNSIDGGELDFPALFRVRLLDIDDRDGFAPPPSESALCVFGTHYDVTDGPSTNQFALGNRLTKFTLTDLRVDQRISSGALAPVKRWSIHVVDTEPPFIAKDQLSLMLPGDSADIISDGVATIPVAPDGAAIEIGQIVAVQSPSATIDLGLATAQAVVQCPIHGGAGVPTINLCPTELNVCVSRGDSKPFVLNLQDAAGVAIDITGRTYLLTVDSRDEPDDVSTQVFQISGTIVGDPADGQVQFAPSAANNDQLPNDYFLDVQETNAGEIRTLAKGVYTVQQDITK